ncbi:CRTAC1 family protein [Candidatus Nitrospira allomarina]|uniref:CRTAC1 family protein n=1 Tax=Candidatus Nitrospira allomarina TaxID=3020900 RepID=A0AA96GDL5_9BACT|nr:CRTAC1 family protein [Candidatus Nitrospira allomarina]WNM58025.1 CRTAC1 family protein [Candidatus Nitrospira allomarina]
MKKEQNTLWGKGLLVASLVLTSASCIPTHEKLTHPANPIDVQPFQEITVEFVHQWDQLNHPFSGAAVIDVDQDGTMELFVGGGGGQEDALFTYRHGRLVNIIQGSGLSSTIATYGATSIDMDHDGDTDLLIARDDGISLYLNDHGIFTQQRIPLHLEPDAVPLTIAVSDINHDGHGDLYVSVFVSKKAFHSATFNDPTHAKHNIMLLNNGDLTFTDITEASGTASKQNTFLSVFVDLDGDGWQDLVVAQNTGEVEIFKNERNTTFTPIATNSGYGFWMGLAVGDVDKDGDQDLFFTNVGTSISHYFLKGDIKDVQRLESQWLLLRNDGNLVFTDVTEAYGLRDYGFAWGTVFEDINLDGHLDILTAQNYIKWPVHKVWKLPGKSFLQVPSSPTNSFVHVDDLGLTNPFFGQAPVIADLNGDTKPDVIWLNMNGPVRAFLNRSTANGIGIALPDSVQSLGTQVTVETTSGRSYTKQIVTSVGLLSDQSPTLFFGLGEEREVAKVHIQDPDGTVSIIEHPSINQSLIVQERVGNQNTLQVERKGQ